VKLIKLTNAAKGRIGEGLILNTDLIASFFEHKQEDGTCGVWYERQQLGSLGEHGRDYGKD